MEWKHVSRIGGEEIYIAKISGVNCSWMFNPSHSPPGAEAGKTSKALWSRKIKLFQGYHDTVD
jgi:hypothetical protein